SDTYKKSLNLSYRLTNPPEEKDLSRWLAVSAPSDIPEKGIYFHPPSRSVEVELLERLYRNSIIPEGFNLADELIDRIRKRKVSLHPKTDSGWYDYQIWALEPLVIPEQMREY